jgi:transketolase
MSSAQCAASGFLVSLSSHCAVEVSQQDSVTLNLRQMTAAWQVSVEAGTTFGWERYIGPKGISIGVDRFGASAPGPTLYEKFGITVNAAVKAAQSLM